MVTIEVVDRKKLAKLVEFYSTLQSIAQEE